MRSPGGTQPIAEEHDEEWAAALDFIKADFEDNQLALFLGVGRAGFDALPKINPFEVMPALPPFLLQTRQNKIPQMVALRLHVAERGTDEDGTRAPLRSDNGEFRRHCVLRKL